MMRSRAERFASVSGGPRKLRTERIPEASWWAKFRYELQEHCTRAMIQTLDKKGNDVALAR